MKDIVLKITGKTLSTLPKPPEGSVLIDDHIGFYTGTKDGGKNRLRQGYIYFITDNLLNGHDRLADLTFAVSVNFRKERPTVTNVAQVSYLNPLAGDTLYSESRLIKDGKEYRIPREHQHVQAHRAGLDFEGKEK